MLEIMVLLIITIAVSVIAVRCVECINEDRKKYKEKIDSYSPKELNERLMMNYLRTNKIKYYKAYKSDDLMFKRQALQVSDSKYSESQN